MTPLKEKIINYILKFISERDREVRVSDLLEVIMNQFGSELKENCNDSDNPFSDEMFAKSVIREPHVVYGLTYTAEDDSLVGLTEEGQKAANHPKGVSGYLDDIAKEKKSLEVRTRIQSYAETIAAIATSISFLISCFSPNTLWLNNLGYLACGTLIGFGATRIFRIVTNKIRK